MWDTMIYEYSDLNSMMLSGYRMTEMQEEGLGWHDGQI